MCVYKVNKLSPFNQSTYLEKQIYTVYGQTAGEDYDGSSYTYAEYLADTLNKLNCGTWQATNVGPHGVANAIVKSVGMDIAGGDPVINTLARGWPIIILTKWTRDGGGHFVVVDTVNNFMGSLFASVCDPWDGDVHIVPFRSGSVFHYVGRHQPLSFDNGGKKHNYHGESAGNMNGWIVQRVR
jgi:hypothetical protein